MCNKVGAPTVGTSGGYIDEALLREALGDDELFAEVQDSIKRAANLEPRSYILHGSGEVWELGSATLQSYENCAKSTQDGAATALTMWLRWCDWADVDPDHFTVDDVREYGDHRIDEHMISARYFNDRLQYLDKHARVCERAGTMRVPWLTLREVRVPPDGEPARWAH
jgi:hypothetical protein